MTHQELSTPRAPTVMILAPRSMPSFGSGVFVQAHQYVELQHELQRLRGEVYKEYAGVAATLTEDGLDRQTLDDLCWHVLVRDPGTGGLAALSLIHISEPTRLGMISYAVFCLK